MSNKRSRSEDYSSSKENQTKNNDEPNNDPHSPGLIEGQERKIHEKIIDRRITGGVPLTEEGIIDAYASALKQWEKLPGSIVRPSTDVTSQIQKHAKSERNSNTSEKTDNETNNGD